MMEQEEDITAIYNAIGRPPGWLVRNGIVVVFSFLIVLFVLGWFVRYPDTLELSGELLVGSRPVEVVARISGITDSLYAGDKSSVREGDIVLSLRSTLQRSATESFQRFSEEFDAAEDLEAIVSMGVERRIELGELTPLYTKLVHDFLEFQDYIKDSTFALRMNSLRRELLHTEELSASLSVQEAYYKQELDLTERHYRRSESFHERGVVTAVDKETAESGLLSGKRQLESYRTNRLTNGIRREQLGLQLSTIASEREHGLNMRRSGLFRQIEELRSALSEWEDRHVLRAPVDGRVSYSSRMLPNQYVNGGDVVFTVIGAGDREGNRIEGRLPVRSSGTLSSGQPAKVEFENYPGSQYGVLWGEVSYISELPEEDSYLVRISVSEELLTTYGKKLPSTPLMRARVTIITKEYSILDRILHTLREIIENSNG